MLDMELALAAAAVLFVSSFTPGPNNAVCIALAASGGFWRALPWSLGVMSGFRGVDGICRFSSDSWAVYLIRIVKKSWRIKRLLQIQTFVQKLMQKPRLPRRLIMPAHNAKCHCALLHFRLSRE